MPKHPTYDVMQLISDAKPEVRATTLKAYYFGLKRAAPPVIQGKLGKGLSTNPIRLDWIKDVSATLGRMDGFSVSVQRQTLTPLLVISKYLYDGDTYTSYLSKFIDLGEQFKEDVSAHQKTPAQASNWLTLAELKDFALTLPTDTKKQQLQRMVAILYTYQPPVRNDYGEMELITSVDDIHPDINYLLVIDGEPKAFIFQRTKVSKDGSVHTVSISDGIVVSELMGYLDGRDSGYLFGDPKSKGQIGYALQLAFADMGKHVTINLLRHITASEHVDIEARENATAIAKAMMHGDSMQVQYAKK